MSISVIVTMLIVIYGIISLLAYGKYNKIEVLHMKVDEKKYFSLSELINYVFKNKIKDARYYSESGSYIDIKDYKLVSTVDILPNDRFLVKYTVYSDLTLDTKISYFLEKDIYYNYREHQNKAINDLSFLDTTAQIWLINHDNTHTLIWKYGSLVK